MVGWNQVQIAECRRRGKQASVSTLWRWWEEKGKEV